MITCSLRYIIDPYKLKEFQHYGKIWIPLVEKYGGQHHGYFLPSEGASNVALALFSFPSSFHPQVPGTSSPIAAGSGSWGPVAWPSPLGPLPHL